MPERSLKPLPTFVQVVFGFASAVSIEVLTFFLKLVSSAVITSISHALPIGNLVPTDWFEVKEALSAAAVVIVVIILLVWIIVVSGKYLNSLIQTASLIVTLVILGAFEETLLSWLNDPKHEHVIGHCLIMFVLVCASLLLLFAYQMVKDEQAGPAN